MAEGGGRSAKRQKPNNWGGAGKTGRKGDNKAKYRSHAAHAAGRGAISASGLQSGDVGIFVSSDKGKEKACLREMEDLLSEALGLDDDDGEAEGERGAVDSGNAQQTGEGETPQISSSRDEANAEQSMLPKLDFGGAIEDEIQRELAAMAGNDIVGAKRKRGASKLEDRHQQDESVISKKPRLGLVTLDIPCVSFVRFPPSTNYDPVKVVEKLCQEAKAHPESQRSRFVKRLTPLTKVRKVMSGGVEELCRDILPGVFGGDHGARGWKYAVRVTVRNNNQVVKDDIIKMVAGEVRQLGLDRDGDTGGDIQSRHKVDLKGYEKLVLVEVYRNVVGMAVVDDDWESLRRFNLAEIYADGRKARDESAAASREETTGNEQHQDAAHVAAEAATVQSTTTAGAKASSLDTETALAT